MTLPNGATSWPGVRDRIGRFLTLVARWASVPSDSPDERRRRAMLAVTTLVVIVVSCFWVALYASLGLWVSAAIPFAYQVISVVCFALCVRGRRPNLLLYAQLVCMLVLPFVLQWTLGGFVNASAVMLWAILAPVGALVFSGPNRALPWFTGFALLTVASGLIDPLVSSNAPDVPHGVQVLMFVLNIGTPAAIVFLLLRYYSAALQREREKSDWLLYQMLPAQVAERLRERPGALADSVPEVTILFADLVGFTPLSLELRAEELIGLLNHLFTEFDRLAQAHGVEKITTLGDGYIAAGGVPVFRADHAEAVAGFAIDMQAAVVQLAAELGRDLRIRIGINTGGPVVAGVVGTTRYLYTIVGDAMNTASRMESHGLPGRIQVSETTYERLRDRFEFEDRGVIEVKGKGAMHTYLLVGARSPLPKRQGQETSTPG